MIQKMEHTAIMVQEMERSIQFYCDVLGFNVRLRGRKHDREMAFFYLESQPDMEIELICDVDSAVGYNEDGIVNHLAFTVNDIEAAIGYLKDKRVEFCSDEIKSTLEGGRMILFWGPSRELLQLVERVNN